MLGKKKMKQTTRKRLMYDRDHFFYMLVMSLFLFPLVYSEKLFVIKNCIWYVLYFPPISHTKFYTEPHLMLEKRFTLTLCLCAAVIANERILIWNQWGKMNYNFNTSTVLHTFYHHPRKKLTRNTILFKLL